MKVMDAVNQQIKGIGREWGLTPDQQHELSLFNLHHKLEFVVFYDLVTSLFSLEEERISWVTQSPASADSYLSQILNNPENLEAINKKLRWLINP